jgi:hypothetical protein
MQFGNGGKHYSFHDNTRQRTKNGSSRMLLDPF